MLQPSLCPSPNPSPSPSPSPEPSPNPNPNPNSDANPNQVSPMLQPAVLLTCMLQYFLNQTRRVKNGMALTHESWPDGTNSKKKVPYP